MRSPLILELELSQGQPVLRITGHPVRLPYLLSMTLAFFILFLLAAAVATAVAMAAAPAAAPDGSWCPRFHGISGHYDPSGPILKDGVWHVFPDGGAKGWSHYTSTDLLRWTLQEPAPVVGNGDTGSVSVAASGVGTPAAPAIALYPALSAAPPGYGLYRQEASAPGGLSPTVQWGAPTFVAKKPDVLGVSYE